MTNQVIAIDRKKYAVGLFWQPVAIGFVGRNYAQQLTRGVDKKLNLFTEYRAMIGLGSRKLGHRVAMPSAAAEVMEAFAEYSSFLAVFKVQEIFWMVAVRNGIIIRDQLFETEDEARTEFVKLSDMPDWGSLFAPASWGLPRLVERHVEDVVFGNVKATLKTISRLRADLFSLALFLLFILGILYFFKDPIGQMLTPRPQVSNINPDLAEEYRKRIDENDKELDKKFDIKKQAPDMPAVMEMPYERLPDPAARAVLCYQAIGFLMQPITGWVQESAECNETHASVIFRRTHGTLNGFYEVATDFMPGAFVQERSESEIYARAKLPLLPAYASLDERDGATNVREVNTLFQKTGMPVDTNITVDVVSDGNTSVSLNIVEIAAASKLTPPEFMKIFDEFGGVYMTHVAWDARSRTWNYEVIIYAK